MGFSPSAANPDGLKPILRQNCTSHCSRGRSPFSSGAVLGGCVVGVFRPGVLGITAAEILADLMIGRPPEAGQVVGHLLRTMVGGQEMPEHGNAAPATRGVSNMPKISWIRTASTGGLPGS